MAADLAETLVGIGYEVVATVATGEDAVVQAAGLAPDIVLMDIRLAGYMDGIQAAALIKQHRDVPVVFLTAHSDDETLTRAVATGPLGYIVKPFREPDLRCAIELALHRHEIDRRLQEREQWLATTIRSIGDAVVATDCENRITFLNPVAQALLGWTEATAVGQTLDDILRIVGDRSGNPIENPLRRAMTSKLAARLPSDAILVRPGGTMPINDSAAPILDDKGSVVGGVMVFRDATEQRRSSSKLEDRVIQRTTQLEAANKELEAFSYSVAHDLRAPLRGIDGISQMLIEDHAANLGAEGLDHLQRIRTGTRRMSQLIDDLLRLARVAQAELTTSMVDLSALANEIIGELAPPRHARITIDTGVTAYCDEHLLRIVLTNLLANALKFTSKVATPEITFGLIASDGAPVYYVRDNGAGFDMSFAFRLFGAFQRMHSISDFEGTGIGLAIVQRVVHRHGGRIWADAEV
ncbi:MAG TPA: response regulator, partial [Kofleriaceae bacterium]|nr:response regulator [Kofleriaceae bacterium]